MSILTRYICRRLLYYYVGFVVVMLVFFVFFDFMEHIQRLTKDDASLSLLAQYYACYLPRVFTMTSWVGFLISMMLVYGGLARNNEFTALLAGGVSIYRVGAPALFIGCVLSAAVFLVQEFIVPVSMLRAYELKDSKFSEDPGDRRVSRIANIGRRNQFYLIDSLDTEKGLLTGVEIHTRNGGVITSRIDAERAVWDESTERWFLHNVVIRKFDAYGAVTGRSELVTLKAPFKESPATLKMSASTRGELNFRQLRDKIKNLERSGYPARRLKLDYQKKFALPLANLIAVLLGLPFALECRGGGLVLGFALSLGAALSYYGAFQVSLALGNSGILPVAVAAWLANFVFLGVGAGLIVRART